MSNNYYVYAYLDPQGTPFYVGAGHGKRDTRHTRLCQRKKKLDCPHFYKKLRKMLRQGIQPTVIRIAENLKKEEAFGKWESFFIAAVGRLDLRTGPLCNLTAGGEGFRSLVRSMEHRRKIREAARRRMENGEFNSSTFNFKGHAHSAEARRKLSEDRIGKARSEETRQKMSEATKGRASATKGKVLSKKEKERRDAKLIIGLLDAYLTSPRRTAMQIEEVLAAEPHDGRKFKDTRWMDNRWYAHIQIDAKHCITRGSFTTEVEAARVYNSLVDQYRGGNGRKNQVD